MRAVGAVEFGGRHGPLAAAVGDGHAGEQAAELVVGPEDAHPRQYTANFKKWVWCSRRYAGTSPCKRSRPSTKFHPNQVGAWKRQAIDGLEEVLAGGTASRDSEHEATIRDLHAKLGELTVEPDSA